MSCEHGLDCCDTCGPFAQPAPADPLTAQVVACIATTVKAIESRLRSKGDMYAPDAEWTRLQDCAQALRNAGRELERVK